MITFEEAYNIAKTRKPVIVRCIENDDAYIFSGNEKIVWWVIISCRNERNGKIDRYGILYLYIRNSQKIRYIPIEMYLFKCVLNELLSKCQKEGFDDIRQNLAQ